METTLSLVISAIFWSWILGLPQSLIEWVRDKFEADKVEPARPAPAVRGACGHGHLVEVESGGEIVAYICQRCDEQVMPDNRAAVAHEDRKRVNAEWRETWKPSTRQQQEAEEIALAKLEIQE